MTGAHGAARTGRGLPFQSRPVRTRSPCLAETVGESGAFSPGNCQNQGREACRPDLRVPPPRAGPRPGHFLKLDPEG